MNLNKVVIERDKKKDIEQERKRNRRYNSLFMFKLLDIMYIGSFMGKSKYMDESLQLIEINRV